MKKMKPLGKKKAAKGKAEAKASNKAGTKRAIPKYNRSWDEADASAAARASRMEQRKPATKEKITN